MLYSIANDVMEVKIDSRGGELQSIRREGREYLWQGDPAYWDGKAPNLFPYIARLTGGKYMLNGRTYELPIHGFLPYTQMVCEEQSAERIVFRLDADEKTKECYPFDFTCRIIYELDEEMLNVTYQVENHGEETMYFGIGGHPGFQVPPGSDADGPAFEEHWLEFEGVKEYDTPLRVGFTPACFLDGTQTPFPLEDGRRLRLRHDMFDGDAIVLTHTSSCVSLGCEKSTRRVRVSFPDMPYIGFWHAVGTDAPYICIEPWTSLPSRQDVVEDLAEQPGLIALKGGGTGRYRWSVEIQ